SDELGKKLLDAGFLLQVRTDLSRRVFPIFPVNERSLHQEVQKCEAIPALHETGHAPRSLAFARIHGGLVRPGSAIHVRSLPVLLKSLSFSLASLDYNICRLSYVGFLRCIQIAIT